MKAWPFAVIFRTWTTAWPVTGIKIVVVIIGTDWVGVVSLMVLVMRVG